MTECKKIEFFGGSAGAFAPVLVLFAGIIALVVRGEALPMAFWVPALGAILTALLFAKKKSDCAEELLRGMASPMLVTMMFSWFLAGIVAEILAESGFVDSLIWLCARSGLPPRFFPALVFIIGCLYSSAVGTALGSIIALTPILYPVGQALGCSGAEVLGAIVSAAYFGDNLAPVSDTTIASAYSQGVGVAMVVRSRAKYSFIAAGIALVLFAVFGSGSGSYAGTFESFGPKGLIMIFVPALLIVLMYRGLHLILAFMVSAVFGLVLGLAAGLLDPANLLTVDTAHFKAGGIIIDGMMGLLDITVFAFLLIGLTHVLERAGFFARLIGRLKNLTGSSRSAELTITAMNIALNMVTAAATAAIVMMGPVARKTLVLGRGITRDRSANILDAVACAVMCVIPWSFGPILAFVSAAGAGGPPEFSLWSICVYSFHGWALLAVMLFSIISGWGRTEYSDVEYKAVKEQENEELGVRS